MNTELFFQTVHSANHQFLRGRHGLMLEHFSHGQWSFDHGGTRRSVTWKQDAGQRKLPNIGKECTNDTII